MASSYIINSYRYYYCVLKVKTLHTLSTIVIKLLSFSCKRSAHISPTIFFFASNDILYLANYSSILSNERTHDSFSLNNRLEEHFRQQSLILNDNLRRNDSSIEKVIFICHLRTIHNFISIGNKLLVEFN